MAQSRFLVLIALVWGCGERPVPPPRAAQDSGVTASVVLPEAPSVPSVAVDTFRSHFAQTARDTALVRAARRLRTLLDSTLREGHARLLLAAHIADSDLVFVKDTLSWPDADLSASYGVLLDASGRPQLAYESPSNEAGDIFIMRTHYFDANGNTVLFVQEATLLQNGCTRRDSTRVTGGEETAIYLDRMHREIQREYALRAVRGPEELLDPTRCVAANLEARAFDSWGQFADSTGLRTLPQMPPR